MISIFFQKTKIFSPDCFIRFAQKLVYFFFQPFFENERKLCNKHFSDWHRFRPTDFVLYPTSYHHIFKVMCVRFKMGRNGTRSVIGRKLSQQFFNTLDVWKCMKSIFDVLRSTRVLKE